MNELSKPISQKAGVMAYRSGEDGGVEVLLITARINPETWIFPVGTVKKRETLQQTAARECEEESGYIVDVGSKLAEIEFDKAESVSRMTFFGARVTGETTWRETDRQRKWVQPSELTNTIAKDFLPVARAAIEWLATLPSRPEKHL